MELLVDSTEFWTILKEDIQHSRKRVFIQVLSFEGDQAGKLLFDLLSSLRPEIEIKIIVDRFMKFILSDKFLFFHNNIINSSLHKEFKLTRQMFESLERSGVKIKFVYPSKPYKFLSCDHKKILVIDGKIAYFGGLNFSDHNFEWHDLMVRVTEQDVVNILEQSFISKWCAKDKFLIKETSLGEILILDGHLNEKSYNRIFSLIKNAQSKIFVMSPYLTFPMMDHLKDARQRGVKIVVITPESNNRQSFRDYIFWEASGSDINLYLLKGMFHLKAILIDDTHLILGSSNFDFLSYRIHQEIIFVINEKTIIEEFKHRVVLHDLQHAYQSEGKRDIKIGLSVLYLRFIDFLCSLM